MWIKQYLDGSSIAEDRALGITWLKTPLSNLLSVTLRAMGPHGGIVERSITGYKDYWHSKTAVANESCKPIIVAERIQGLRHDGMWDTVLWNGNDFIDSVENRAIGKPVTK
jgi:hypothetical protein